MELTKVDLLPSLTAEEVENLITFLYANADDIFYAREYEICCGSDGAMVGIQCCGEALRLGYGMSGGSDDE